jgi:hypothetical protein
MATKAESAERAVTLATVAGLPADESAALRRVILAGGQPKIRPTPQRIPSAHALRIVGRRSEIHPRDAVAFRYGSHEMADLSEYLNREFYGNEIAGRVMLDNGILLVIDLRPVVRRLGCSPADPALPDSWGWGGAP